jgi:hypothetical protein
MNGRYDSRIDNGDNGRDQRSDRSRADGADGAGTHAGTRTDNRNDGGGEYRDAAPPSPLGQRFPSVGGTSLSGDKVRFPDDLAGAPAVLLVAYQRMAQVDVSSWLAFLESREPGLMVYEVPTIPAIAYRPWAGWIDDRMRKGLPQALWPRVVTLYDEGAPVRDLLGDNDFAGASVVLLDADGVVRWFSAQGFSADRGGDLLDELRDLEDAPAA